MCFTWCFHLSGWLADFSGVQGCCFTWCFSFWWLAGKPGAWYGAGCANHSASFGQGLSAFQTLSRVFGKLVAILVGRKNGKKLVAELPRSFSFKNRFMSTFFAPRGPPPFGGPSMLCYLVFFTLVVAWQT